ncbi:MAG TPA: ferredoxin-type protein NapF [Azospirillum sp.]|nr:ferredoxin-type protein NapF [Azospirillum sp.]
MGAVSRFSFLRGRLSGEPDAIRPPWAVADADVFARACDRCGRCAPACTEGLIRFDRAGFPTISFMAGGCSFCGACADACPTPALDRTNGRAPWHLKASISAGCLSFTGVDCRICGEHCEARAIRFRPLGRGRWLPDVEAGRCTGCGACEAPCPVAAIAVRADANQKETAACG